MSYSAAPFAGFRFHRSTLVVGTLAACLALIAPGCKPAAPPGPTPEPKPTDVKFVYPTESSVTPYEEFGGRAAAPELVELRARVSGYLRKVNFHDGDTVKQGDILFEIEDLTYRANLAQAEATVEQRIADVGRLKAQLARANRLAATKAVTEQEIENLTFETKAAEAAQAAAEAARDRSLQDYDFTKVVAPISGVIGRRLIDPGNLVEADQTHLATIVSQNPIHAYFDYDERSVLAMRRLVEQGKLKEAPDRSQNVSVALAGETKYGLAGRIDWVDNQIDMNTGTLRARVEVPNDKRLLSPGMFVRLRVPLGPEEPAILIPEEALGADQGQRFVYVVNESNEIEYRPVVVGWLTEGKRVIRSGLKPDDRVVVTGLQRIRPKAKVIPTEWSLPTAKPNDPPNGAKPDETSPAKSTPEKPPVSKPETSRASS